MKHLFAHFMKSMLITACMLTVTACSSNDSYIFNNAKDALNTCHSKLYKLKL